MELRQQVDDWFDAWEGGDFHTIPVADDFVHTSPFGTIEGKTTYLALVAANRGAFLGFSFEIHDAIYEDDRACVRYTARKGEYAMEVSEWFYGGPNGITEIVSYYNVGGASYGDFDSG